MIPLVHALPQRTAEHTRQTSDTALCHSVPQTACEAPSACVTFASALVSVAAAVLTQSAPAVFTVPP